MAFSVNDGRLEADTASSSAVADTAAASLCFVAAADHQQSVRRRDDNTHTHILVPGNE